LVANLYNICGSEYPDALSSAHGSVDWVEEEVDAKDVEFS
jgi:hypothetical protein